LTTEAAGLPAESRALSATVDAFLDALASGAPTPGGGGAAALAGALAAALVGMVARVTAAREPATAHEATAVVAEADELRRRLTALVDEDAQAYRAVIASRASGSSAAESALKRATDAPLAIAGECGVVLALCERLAPVARRSALSDLRVAAALARCALDCGAQTARVNVQELRDADVAQAAAREIEDRLREAEVRHRVVSGAIAARGA
jgi:formiminotetrahydrofolate cyclodeaminase